MLREEMKEPSGLLTFLVGSEATLDVNACTVLEDRRVLRQ
jgi:hypothetical protein